MKKKVLGGPGRIRKKINKRKTGGTVESNISNADKELIKLREKYMKKNKKQIGGAVYNAKGKKIPGMQMGGITRNPSADYLESLHEKDMKGMHQRRPLPRVPEFPGEAEPKSNNQYDEKGNLIQTPGMNRSMLTQEMIDAGYTADEKGFIDGPTRETEIPEIRPIDEGRNAIPAQKKREVIFNKMNPGNFRRQKGGAVYTKKGMRIPGMRKGR
jgi:hypothetical protein